ncbi:hypothetical protein EDC01DRAFT_634846 [Geopyxis carbonaria]|nr:hypothetical protein EDC01DRAFT_634846 [Geopyxis carbonaria]
MTAEYNKSPLLQLIVDSIRDHCIFPKEPAVVSDIRWDSHPEINFSESQKKRFVQIMNDECWPSDDDAYYYASETLIDTIERELFPIPEPVKEKKKEKKEKSWTGVWSGTLSKGPDGKTWDGSWTGVMKTKYGSSKRRHKEDDEDDQDNENDKNDKDDEDDEDDED